MGAEAVVDPVVACQVAARFGGGDQVIGGHGILGVGQGDVPDRGTHVFVDLQGGTDGLLHFGVEPGAEKFLRQADGQGLDRLVQGPGVGWNRQIDAGAVARVMAGDCFQKEGGVKNVMCEGADLIQRAAVGDQAEARHAAIGWLEADDAAQAGGQANGAAGVGAKGQGRHASRHRRGRAAAGAARYAFQVPGIARHLVSAVLGGRAHGELVEIGLAQENRIRLAQFADDMGIIRRHEVFENLAAAGGGLPLGAQNVLDGDRNAGERTERFTALAFAVDASCLFKGRFFIDVKKRLDGRIALANTF